MSKEILQIENTNTTDFKNEIISGVREEFKILASSLQGNNEDEIWTRAITAKTLSVSLVTLYHWTKKDILPAYRIGNKVRYKKSEVLSALKQMNKFSK